MFKVIRQAGIGLLELMLSLTVIAVLLVVVLQWYPKLERSRKVHATVEMVQLAQAATVRWRALPRPMANDGMGVSVSRFIQMGLLNDHWRLSPWGQAWRLQSMAGHDRYVQVVIPGIPQGLCRYMAVLLAQQHVASGYCMHGVYQGQLMVDGNAVS